MPRELASSLPYDALVHIFSYAVNVPTKPPLYGGALGSWDSHETMKKLALVCKGWTEAAMTVLYRSVALIDPGSAGKGDGGRRSPYTAAKYLSESLELVEVLRRCAPTLTHLQVHPLHAGARDALFSAFRGAEALHTLICSPRFHRFTASPDEPAENWGANFYSRTDLPDLVLPPRLRVLELDFESSWEARTLSFHNGISAAELTKLHLRCDTDEDVLWQVLAKCSALEVCELYFEKLLARDETTAALQASTSTMKHMQFLSNPTVDDLAFFDDTATPIFDRLLPSYTHLESLRVSATEVSFYVFRLIPPSLAHLEIQAFNHVSTFVFSPQLLLDLANPANASGLRSFSVHDAAEAWDERDIAALRQACEKRGIDFWFRPDSDASSR
ncbi:hypothetical protein JCM10207_001810 [Rhodosporidiobolus poonsookiae]